MHVAEMPKGVREQHWIADRSGFGNRCFVQRHGSSRVAGIPLDLGKAFQSGYEKLLRPTPPRQLGRFSERAARICRTLLPARDQTTAKLQQSSDPSQHSGRPSGRKSLVGFAAGDDWPPRPPEASRRAGFNGFWA
jgi:hypothetical protein